MNLQKSQSEYQKAQDLIFNGVKRMNMLADVYKYPLYFEKSKGAYTWDIDGNKYIDFISGKGAIVLGYSDDSVNKAVKDQIDRSNFMPLNSTAQNNLAELFIKEIPCAERVRFFRTGSCAASALIRLARACTGKDIILTTGYHGWHDSFMGGRAGVPTMIDQNVMSFNYSLDLLKSLMESFKEKIAAIFITPEPCFFNKNFYLDCYNIAKENKVLFLLDEVKTGFRVNLHGYQHILDIVPDGACFSKAMSNGYPISAVAGSIELMEAEERTHLSGTFDTEVSCMEAAIQTIKQLKINDIHEIINKNGKYFADQLSEVFNEYNFPAICKSDDPTAFHIVFKNEKTAEDFYCGCADRGVLFYCNNNVMMNASHTIEVIDIAVNVCRDTIKHMDNYPMLSIDNSDITAYLKRSRIQR